MLLGVPVFAVIYLIISDIVNSALRKKQKTTVTDEYYDIQRSPTSTVGAEAARQAVAEAADTPDGRPKSVGTKEAAAQGQRLQRRKNLRRFHRAGGE